MFRTIPSVGGGVGGGVAPEKQYNFDTSVMELLEWKRHILKNHIHSLIMRRGMVDL